MRSTTVSTAIAYIGRLAFVLGFTLFMSAVVTLTYEGPEDRDGAILEKIRVLSKTIFPGRQDAPLTSYGTILFNSGLGLLVETSTETTDPSPEVAPPLKNAAEMITERRVWTLVSEGADAGKEMQTSGGSLISSEAKNEDGPDERNFPDAIRGIGGSRDSGQLFRATAISGNGQVVVGYQQSDRDISPAYWTKEEGIVALHPPTGFDYMGQATAVSADGATICGTASPREFGTSQAVVWSGDARTPRLLGQIDAQYIDEYEDTVEKMKERSNRPSLVALGALHESRRGMSQARAVTDDGGTIVGTVVSPKKKTGTTGNVARDSAFQWTEEGGYCVLPDELMSDSWSDAYDVSGDGHVIVGSCSARFVGGVLIMPSREEVVPCIWREGKVSRIYTGDLGSGSKAILELVSGDGNVMFGTYKSDGVFYRPPRPFRYVDGTYKYLEGATPNETLSIDATVFDGSVAVGDRSVSGGKGSSREAIVWDEQRGVRSLADVLVEREIDLSDWELETATDITPNGKIVIGHGKNPAGEEAAWVITFSKPL